MLIADGSSGVGEGFLVQRRGPCSSGSGSSKCMMGTICLMSATAKLRSPCWKECALYWHASTAVHAYVCPEGCSMPPLGEQIVIVETFGRNAA